MNNVTIFWILIGIVATVFFLLTVREMNLLLRIPKGHPERGYCWFNALFLFASVILIVWFGNYIDSSRRTLESFLPVPEFTRYAIERNSIIHGTNWTYVSKRSIEDVRLFYRQYASENLIPIIEDVNNGVRLSFSLPSGDLFLTLTQEGGGAVLYFSREGQITTRIIPSAQ